MSSEPEVDEHMSEPIDCHLTPLEAADGLWVTCARCETRQDGATAWVGTSLMVARAASVLLCVRCRNAPDIKAWLTTRLRVRTLSPSQGATFPPRGP